MYISTLRRLAKAQRPYKRECTLRRIHSTPSASHRLWRCIATGNALTGAPHKSGAHNGRAKERNLGSIAGIPVWCDPARNLSV